MIYKPPSLENASFSKVLARLQSREDLKDRIKHVELIRSTSARFRSWPKGLSPQMVQLLEKSGFEALWTHQADAVDAILSGKHVAVTTPTA